MADTPKQSTPQQRADNPQAVPQPKQVPDDQVANSDPIAPQDEFESPHEQHVIQTDPHRDLAPEEDDEYFNEFRTPGEMVDVHDLHAAESLSQYVPAKPTQQNTNFQPLPLWTVAAGLILLWGGYYMGANNGNLQGDVFNDEASYKPVAVGPPVDPNSPEALATAGQKVFTVNCAQCHQSTGLGVAGQFPPLVGSEWVVGDAPKRLQQILLHGLQGSVSVKGASFNNAMPAWNQTLSDKQIAQVLTYIRTKLGGNSAGPITEAQMASARKETADRTDPWTEKELLAIPAGPIDGGTPPAPASGNQPANSNPTNSPEGAAKPAAAGFGEGPAAPAASPKP